jgi:fused signal recognition particle receptor
MRFFRRGGEPKDEQPEESQQPTEEAADLIGDEWAQGSPDDAVTADVPLDAAPALHPVTGGAGILEPVHVPSVPEPAPEPPAVAETAPAVPEPVPEPPAVAETAPAVPEPVPDAGPAPEPAAAQWAWGADWSAEKADAARREREREQLEQGLEKSRTGFGARLRSAFGAGGSADWDEIEETLITGDVGAALSMDIVERARRRRDVSAEDAVRAELAGLLAPRDAEHWEPVPSADGMPAIVLVVGVNGTGKTTTIGKLAARERASSRRVVLAAADTFRAAAIDQLRIWAQRTDSEIVAHKPNADPAAVVYDALDAAIARHADIVIADTAGRLHTKSNLMDELSKIRRMIDKRIPGAVVETFFVLDATTGQNGLAQAKAFHTAVGLTGVILTKLDSTAKGGIVFAIEKELGVPVRFVGVGEQADDLLPFDPQAFVEALFE